MYRLQLRIGIVLCGVLGLVLGAYADILAATSCRTPLPTDATLVQDFYLCESDHTGQADTYSCRDYRSANQRFRVFYKGGHIPEAVARVRDRSSEKSLTYLELSENQDSICNIAPPKTIPRTARFIGSGVCEDENEKPVPCSVFRAAPARQTHVVHYMVFYETNGAGPALIHAQAVSPNHNAFVAELAFQIGSELVNTDCCYEQGLEYLAYASALFPKSETYCETYRWYQLEFQATRKTSCSSVVGSLSQ